MNNEQNILNKLYDYALPVPTHIFDAISKKINEEGDESLDVFKKLNHHSSKLDPALFDTIIATAKKVVPSATAKQGIVRILYRYKWIAACAVVALITTIAFVTLMNHKGTFERSPLIVQGIKNNQPIDSNGEVDIAEEPTEDMEKRKEALEKAMRSENYFYTNSFFFGEEPFSMIDNDLFFTFASYNPNKVPSYFTDAGEATEIRLNIDDFTSIAISPTMRKMMLKMYEVRKNGKSTAKAKREKRKLIRWQKADTKRFDKNVNRNPLDPLDLAEFIFD